MKLQEESHWDGHFHFRRVIYRAGRKTSHTLAVNKATDFDVRMSHRIETGSSVASDSLCVVRMHWGPCKSPTLTIERAWRVESHTAAIATWLPTSLSRKAKGYRGYISRGEGQSPACCNKEPSVEHTTAMRHHHLSLFPTSRLPLLKQPRTLTLVTF